MLVQFLRPKRKLLSKWIFNTLRLSSLSVIILFNIENLTLAANSPPVKTLFLPLKFKKSDPRSPTPYIQMVPFYRSPDSQFPSGEASLEELQAKQLGKILSLSNLEKEHASKGTKSEVRNIPYSKSPAPSKDSLSNNNSNESNALERIQVFQLSTFVQSRSRKETFQIISRRGSWLLGKSQQTQKETWLDPQNLTPQYTDLGTAIVLRPTSLLENPYDETETPLIYLSANTKLYPDFRNIKNQLIKVSFQSSEGKSQIKGFVPLKDLLLKVDFADQLYSDSQKKWVKFVSRQGDKILTNTKEIIPIPSIRYFTTNTSLGYSFTSWNESLLSGHGKIYWKDKTDLIEESSKKTPSLLTSEILKKKWSNIKYNSKLKRGILISDKIYLTLDGIHWQPLKVNPTHQIQWGDNPAIGVSPLNGTFYIGDQVSQDGKYFESFIDMLSLWKLLEKEQLQMPQKIQILSIEPQEKDKGVLLTIDTGLKKFKVLIE